MTLIQFEDLCPPAFSFLTERYHFDGPAVEYHGGEVWALYERGPYTIKVVMVSGTAPHAELFYPAVETGEQALSWASLTGVPRARSIVMPAASRSPRWPDQQREYFEDLAGHLLALEGDRLERWGRTDAKGRGPALRGASMSGFEDGLGSDAVSPPLSGPVRERVEAEYPPAVRSGVERALRRYGSKPHHRDVEGVRLAILELSGGRLEDVEHYASDGDWRDIGYWLTEYHRPFQELLDRLVKRRKLDAGERLSIDRMLGGEYRKLLHLLKLMRARAIRPTKAEFQIIARLGAQMRISPRTWEMLR